MIRTPSTLDPWLLQRPLIVEKKVPLKAKSTKETVRKSRIRREVEVQVVTESQERMARETTVDREVIQEVDPVVQNVDLLAGIDAEETVIERVAVEDTRVGLTEMTVRIGIEIGNETGIGIGKGTVTGRGIEIGTAIVIGIETAEETGTEIETRNANAGTAAGRAAGGREAHPAPGPCRCPRTATAPGQGPGPRPAPAPGAPSTATGTPRHPRPTGRLVRSRQGTDARTEQLAKG